MAQCPRHQPLVIKSHPTFPRGGLRGAVPGRLMPLAVSSPLFWSGEGISSGPCWGMGKPITSVIIQMGSGGTLRFQSCLVNVSCRDQNFTLTGGRLPSVAGSVLSQPLASAVFVAFITTLRLHLCCPARLCNPGICSSHHLALHDQGMTIHKYTDCMCGCLLSPCNQARLSEVNPLGSGQVI